MSAPSFHYLVEFVSATSGSITYTIVSTTPDLDHNVVSDRAEKELVKIWGAEIPSEYAVVNVTVEACE